MTKITMLYPSVYLFVVDGPFSNAMQKEILDADEPDPVFIFVGHDMIPYNYDFLERVVDTLQGMDLLFPFLIRVNMQCRLDVYRISGSSCDEIHFQLHLCLLFFAVAILIFHNTDINRVTCTSTAYRYTFFL